MKFTTNIASANAPINIVICVQERLSEGLALAVAQDLLQELPRKCTHARGLNFSLRRVVRISTTN
jgi:hypothetical protein